MSLSYEWIKSSASEDIPRDAVYAGIHSDGSNIYVGRAYHAGNLLPAKIISRRKSYKKGAEVYCAVSYNKSEIQINNFEVLCGLGPFEWVEDKDGKVPAHAIPGGKSALGEKLYIGRDCVNGALTCGKIQPSRGRLFIPYSGKEHETTSYEVLVLKPILEEQIQKDFNTDNDYQNYGKLLIKWIGLNIYEDIPHNAIYVGADSNGSDIYVGRARHAEELLPAKVVSYCNGEVKIYCAVSYGGSEISVNNFEVLCGSGFEWVKSGNGNVPPNAVVAGKTVTGELLYVGRDYINGALTCGKVHPSHGCLYIPYGLKVHRRVSYEILVTGSECQETGSKLKWVEATGLSSLPSGAIRGGYRADDVPIYVGRCTHENRFMICKVMPNEKQAYCALNGKEYTKTDYEVLYGNNIAWVPASDGFVPPKAVTIGETTDGETLYIGRGWYHGDLTVGTVHPSKNICFVPLHGEGVCKQYEYLVEIN